MNDGSLIVPEFLQLSIPSILFQPSFAERMLIREIKILATHHDGTVDVYFDGQRHPSYWTINTAAGNVFLDKESAIQEAVRRFCSHCGFISSIERVNKKKFEKIQRSIFEYNIDFALNTYPDIVLSDAGFMRFVDNYSNNRDWYEFSV